MISMLNDISGVWFQYIVNASLQLSVFYIVIYLLSRAWKRRSANFLYGLWLVLTLKALLPPVIKVPFERKIDIIPQVDAANLPAFSTKVVLPSISSVSLIAVFFCIWSVVALILIVTAVFNNVRFCMQLRSASLLDRNQCPKKLLFLYRISPGIRIFISDKIKAPFLLYFARPKLYLPDGVFLWNSAKLKAIMLHELAHIKRKDSWVNMLQLTIKILYFFHPFVWLADKQINKYQEHACDDFVIRRMKIRISEYCKLLLAHLNPSARISHTFHTGNYFSVYENAAINRIEYLRDRERQLIASSRRLDKFLLALLVVTALVLSIKTTGIVDDGIIQSNIERLTRKISDFYLLPEKTQPNSRTLAIPAPSPTASQSDDDSIENQSVHDVVNETKTPEPVIRNRLPVKTPQLQKAAKPLAKPTQPELIGGIATIQRNLQYPRVAYLARIEGTVVVSAFIDQTGRVANTRIVKSLGNNGCNEAAVQAILNTRWKPATQAGEAKAVWINIPVRFQIHGRDKKASRTASKAKTKTRSALPKLEYTHPKPIGGYAMIQQHLEIPKVVYSRGQVRIIIQALISKKGEVLKTKVIKSDGAFNMVDATIAAIKKIQWKPALHNNQPVRVWIKIPVTINL